MSNNVSKESSDLTFDLREHNIVMVVPPGTVMKCDLTIPGGILIQGNVTGKIHCQKGSIIFSPESHFVGIAEADKIYIGGSIAHGTQLESSLTARAYLAISEEAVVHANLAAMAFGVKSSNVFGTMRTLAPLPPK